MFIEGSTPPGVRIDSQFFKREPTDEAILIIESEYDNQIADIFIKNRSRKGGGNPIKKTVPYLIFPSNEPPSAEQIEKLNAASAQLKECIESIASDL